MAIEPYGAKAPSRGGGRCARAFGRLRRRRAGSAAANAAWRHAVSKRGSERCCVACISACESTPICAAISRQEAAAGAAGVHRRGREVNPRRQRLRRRRARRQRLQRRLPAAALLWWWRCWQHSEMGSSSSRACGSESECSCSWSRSSSDGSACWAAAGDVSRRAAARLGLHAAMAGEDAMDGV